MEVDTVFFNFLCKEEKCETSVYTDSKNIPTIGIGHRLTDQELASKTLVINGQRVPYAHGITMAQCQALNKQDVSAAVNCVNSIIKVPLTQNQFNALVSFAFNIGIYAFKNSTLVQVLNQKQYKEVPTQMLRWVHENGAVTQGLVNRRNAEIALWNS